MRHSILLSLVLVACVPPTDKTPATDNARVAEPTTTPTPSPTPIDCSGSALLGTWVSQDNPSERWTFNADCSGLNELCNHSFTYPQAYVGFSFVITNISGYLQNGVCTPVGGGAVQNTRTCSWMPVGSSGAFMDLGCNFHGAHRMVKQ